MTPEAYHGEHCETLVLARRQMGKLIEKLMCGRGDSDDLSMQAIRNVIRDGA